MHFSKIFLPFLITVAIAQQNVDNDNDDDDGDDGNDAPNSISSFVHGVVASKSECKTR